MKKSVKIAIGAVVVVAAGAAAVSGLKPKNTEKETVAQPDRNHRASRPGVCDPEGSRRDHCSLCKSW